MVRSQVRPFLPTSDLNPTSCFVKRPKSDLSFDTRPSLDLFSTVRHFIAFGATPASIGRSHVSPGSPVVFVYEWDRVLVAWVWKGPWSCLCIAGSCLRIQTEYGDEKHDYGHYSLSESNEDG